LKRILFLTTGLNVGGAENVLLRLLSKINREKYEIKVISLIHLGPVADKIKDLDIEVVSLKIKSPLNVPKSFYVLLKNIKFFNPDLIHTFMTHAAFFSILIRIFYRRPVIIWNIFCNDLSLKANSFITATIMRICSRFSHIVPQRIIVDSKSAFIAHENTGYSNDRMEIINNGVDTNLFKPKKNLDNNYRAQFFDDSDFIIGMIARYHPVKAHDIFLKAAAIITKKKKGIKFFLNGKGIKNNPRIKEIIEKENIEEFVHLSDDNLDILTILPTCDLLVSSSHFESFPNIICEAMSYTIPCIVTDVGDCKFIVGNHGVSVKPNNIKEIAEASIDMINLPKEKFIKIGMNARKRIIDNFNIDLMSDKYSRLYSEIGK
tara:strand:+ start:1686 stop:2810 length:1125 start_codon:yes stop_codon:yes gene_type:complete